MEIDANVLLALIGQKEVELSYLRERVNYLESCLKDEASKHDDLPETSEE